MSLENIKSFTAKEIERIESVEPQDDREVLLNRMQEILDQEAPLSESDKVELDHIEVELRAFDNLAKENTESERPVVTIGGLKNPNAETFPHKKPL